MRAVLGRLGLMPLAKPLTSKEGHGILERDHYRCQYCGLDGMANFENSLVMTVDFVLPRSERAGRNRITGCLLPRVQRDQRPPRIQNFEEAKAYVLKRRAELRKEWEADMARLHPVAMTAHRSACCFRAYWSSSAAGQPLTARGFRQRASMAFSMASNCSRKSSLRGFGGPDASPRR